MGLAYAARYAGLLLSSRSQKRDLGTRSTVGWTHPENPGDARGC